MRSLLRGISGLAHSRLALLGTEVREELARFAFLLIGASTAVSLAALAVAAACAALILGVPADWRWITAVGLAAVFAGGTALVVWRVRVALAAKPLPFGASLAELEADRLSLARHSARERAAVGEGAGELMRLVSIGVLAYSIARRLRRAA